MSNIDIHDEELQQKKEFVADKLLPIYDNIVNVLAKGFAINRFRRLIKLANTKIIVEQGIIDKDYVSANLVFNFTSPTHITVDDVVGLMDDMVDNAGNTIKALPEYPSSAMFLNALTRTVNEKVKTEARKVYSPKQLGIYTISDMHMETSDRHIECTVTVYLEFAN